MGECRWRGFDLEDGSFRARCSCGWHSPPTATAEEAGGLSDDHRAAVAP